VNTFQLGSLWTRGVGALGVCLLLGCQPSLQSQPLAQPAPAETPPPSAGAAAPLKLRLYNAYAKAADPRFSELPSVIEQAELVPQVTLQVESDLPIASVRFELDGRQRLDRGAPFLLSETEDGKASDWKLTPGSHQLKVVAYSGADANGWVLAQTSRTFVIARDGLDSSPDSGEHRPYRFWITSDGRYVSRNGAGDYVDLRGEVVLTQDQVRLEERQPEQGELVTLTPGAPTLDFAFQVLLPDGYNPAIHYPVVVSLHHGWEVFRGTDNDGRMLKEEPIFSGPESLTRSPNRTRFPAVFVVPQLAKKTNSGGIEHEWGAFSDLDNTTGSVKSAATPSLSGAFTYKILNDLLLGALPVAGARVGMDAARIYVTGHSMGGLGTWDFLQRWPDMWAAGVPMAGYADPNLVTQVRSTPIWAFHHPLDCYNPVAGTRTMQQLIKSVGGTAARFTELSFDVAGKCEQAHFQTPAWAWSEPELPLWLFSQVRGPKPGDH
jgi:hypothetical protein